MDEAYAFIPNSDMTNGTNWDVLFTNDNNETYWNVLPDEYTYNDIPLFLVFIYVIIGTTGNCLVILAILLDQNLKNQTNYLRLSLAVADLLISILSLPGRIVLFNFAIWPSLFPLCYLELVFLEYTFISSIVHIAVISLDTYFTTKNRPNEKEHKTKGGVIKIALIWLTAGITIIPLLIPVSLAIIAGQTNQDHSDNCLNLIYQMPYFNIVFLTEALEELSMVLVIFTTLILITILLYKLAKRQKEIENLGLPKIVSSKNNNESNEKKSSKALKIEQKDLMIVWSLSFTFLICTMPHVYVSTTAATGDYMISSVVLTLESGLLFANICIPPFIYAIFNRRFRDDYKNLILFRYKKVMT